MSTATQTARLISAPCSRERAKFPRQLILHLHDRTAQGDYLETLKVDSKCSHHPQALHSNNVLLSPHNYRFIFGSVAFQNMNRLKSDDVFYTCLPLYHAAAGVMGVGRALIYGNTVILRKRFSASTFWQDCALHKVTVAQHIGEICRYLLRQGYTREEKQHKIRAMIGTGLRAEIWPEFVSRFGIKKIHELYGSTDGNCTMMNFDGRVGAIGFVPVLLRRMSPLRLVRVDPVTGEPLRNLKSGWLSHVSREKLVSL